MMNPGNGLEFKYQGMCYSHFSLLSLTWPLRMLRSLQQRKENPLLLLSCFGEVVPSTSAAGFYQ
jgi:hypothetical protein